VNRQEFVEICGKAGKERGAAEHRRNEPACTQSTITGQLSTVN
jgi:hypothetical protein